MKFRYMGAALMLLSTNLLFSQETIVHTGFSATPGADSPGRSTLYPTCPGVSTVLHGGKSYNTVLIGNQCWLKENLDIGTMIPATSNPANNSIIEKYCYSNLQSNCDTYGGLYTWSEMMAYANTPGVQGICPTGWHIPTHEEWNTLATFLGGGGVAGGKMKTTGTVQAGTGLWNDPNSGATNESGFTAVPGGECSFAQHVFYSKGNVGLFWSSTMLDEYASWFWRVYWNSTEMNFTYYAPANGFSVRCMKVPTVPTVPTTQILQNIGITNGQSACYNALQTITVAGSGSLFTVNPGGSATMIAGQNIQLLPGTKVQLQGYLWGYIAPNGPYCLNPSMPAVISANPELPQKDQEQATFITYPNPTTGTFTLERKGERPIGQVVVEITDSHGETIFKTSLNGKSTQDFSLSNYPAGLYVVRVTSGELSETLKVVKQ